MIEQVSERLANVEIPRIEIPAHPIHRALAATDVSYWHHFTSQTEAAGLARALALFG